mmetsp:Transcript_33311/g.73673  ORF Transcript_33311/g.73673 Transcript_33311/m.73673 type:complete len:255 (-) Transcript_33311:193-957(-)
MTCGVPRPHGVRLERVTLQAAAAQLPAPAAAAAGGAGSAGNAAAGAAPICCCCLRASCCLAAWATVALSCACTASSHFSNVPLLRGRTALLGLIICLEVVCCRGRARCISACWAARLRLLGLGSALRSMAGARLMRCAARSWACLRASAASSSSSGSSSQGYSASCCCCSCRRCCWRLRLFQKRSLMKEKAWYASAAVTKSRLKGMRVGFDELLPLPRALPLLGSNFLGLNFLNRGITSCPSLRRSVSVWPSGR